MEKSLPTTELLEQQHASAPAPRSRRRIAGQMGLIMFIAFCGSRFAAYVAPFQPGAFSPSKALPSCAQPAPLFPVSENPKVVAMYDYLSTPSFENASIIRHSGAVRVATQSYDDMGPIGEDKRWDVMTPFAEYLKATFPRMHKDIDFETVNTHGLLYTWKGSDESLKPLILMAHQDVGPSFHVIVVV